MTISWCRRLVEISTKLRPNFDTQCRSLVSTFARDMNATHGKVNVFDQMSTKLLPNFDQTSTKLRHWGCRSLVEISTKLRHLGVEVWSNIIMCWSNLIICWSHICLFWGQQYDYCLVKHLTICWSNIWLFLFRNLTIILAPPTKQIVRLFKKQRLF